jgi:hypothetical protein
MRANIRQVRSNVHTYFSQTGSAEIYSAARAHPAGNRWQHVWFIPAVVEPRIITSIQTLETFLIVRRRKEGAAVSMFVIERTERCV